MGSVVAGVTAAGGRRRWRLAACLGAGLLLAGCQPETAGAPGATAPAGQLAAAEPDNLVIVECLLPGRVRQMGTRLTYLEPRRPTRTDRRDCAIRGGEYVALDRADYATALAIWIGAANAGDTDAITYVGEIHERGLGRPADPAEAATWYRRAADEGHARAQINLANLYALGRGVPKDEARARALYASATGLATADIELTAASAEPEPVLVPVDAQVAEREREIAELRAALASARREREDMAARLAAAPPPTAEVAPSAAAEIAPSAAAEIERAAGERDLAEEQAAIEAARERRLAELDAELETRRAAFEQELEAERRALATAAEADDAARAEQAARLAALKGEVAALEAQLAQATEPVADGPVIHLFDPELPADGTDVATVVRVRSDVADRTIAGRVESAAGLLSFTVDDRAVETDARGTFRTTVAVPAGGASVTMVAVDRAGQRVQRVFRLEPEAAEDATSPAAETVTASALAQEIARAVDFGRYHALVIGNDAYEHLEPLEMAVGDAEAVAALLAERYGFEVTLLRDATARDIMQAFERLRRTLTENDNLLVYFAGHGTYADLNDLQRGYWIPVDGEPDALFTWISTDQIVEQTDAMSAKQVLIVADSCFSGAFMRTRSALARLSAGRSPEAMIEWYKKRAHLRTRAVLTSGGLEPVLDGGGGGHSVFARAFLDVLAANDDILEAADLYREVAQRVGVAGPVVQLGDQTFRQVPRYARLRHAGDGELADFFFVPTGDGTGA